MAFVERGEIEDGDDVYVMTDFWNLSHDVFPNPGMVTTDVMLIQGMLITYFLAPTPPANLKAEAIKIFSSSRRRFDDGIYGPNTRRVTKLFEISENSPYKDGIFRRMRTSDIVHGPETKLKRLNFCWNMTMLGGAIGDSKQETGQAALNPILYRELYPPML